MTKGGAVIMECEYFPCWEWFSHFMKAENIQIEQYEYFVRTSYRNRAYIAGPNGLITLSVPLEGGRNQKSIMKDLKICPDEDWQALHWKTLEACYGRSVYFEYFQDAMRDFFTKKFDYLLDANLATLDLILNLLQIQKKYDLTQQFEKNVAHDFRNSFLPKNRKAVQQEPYIQTFGDRNGFEPNLSMLDYLFCCGKWS